VNFHGYQIEGKLALPAALVEYIDLNLGSNDDHRPGFINVDRVQPADQIADLTVFPWPWATSSVRCIAASHIVEHLPDRISTMNEMHRVLKPGGRLVIDVPSAAHGSGFAQDPTHCSAWSMNSFGYYEDGHPDWKRFHKSYGITARFKVIELNEMRYMHHREEVWVVHAVLDAVK